MGPLGALGMAALANLAVSSSALTQESESLTVEVGDCVELTVPAERLACFEAQVEAARRERSPSRAPEPRARAPEPSTRAPAAEPTDRARAADARGEPERVAERNRQSGDERDGSDAVGAEIVAKIADLRPTVPNSYVITLDNGQVWRQTRAQYYPLQAGAQVRVFETRWGYRLTDPRLRGFIRVERVR